MSLEQQYYEMLSRTDHPVFRRDLSETTTADSPLNSIFNRVFAKQLVLLSETTAEVALNAFPHTCTALGIDQWEETYFGFTKPNKTLAVRIEELLIKINRRFSMAVPDVIALAEAITGVTPQVIRSLAQSGWILGESALDVNTFISSSTSTTVDANTYVVVFTDSVDSELLALLDSELTRIEKGGAIHYIVAPDRYWTLGESAIEVDTLLG